jgi:transposase
MNFVFCEDKGALPGPKGPNRSPRPHTEHRTDPTAVTILAELGDARRFSSSREAVLYSGLDITVHQSDQRRGPGHLSRQGPPALPAVRGRPGPRRNGSPDRDYYTQAAERLGSNRACLSIARKLLKRRYHTPRELGEEALQPA